MRYRRDEHRSFRGPMGDETRDEPNDTWSRDRMDDRSLMWNRDEDMGGSSWSGASGRGGMRGGGGGGYGGGGGWGGQREHGGFSNYAGGGERDASRHEMGRSWGQDRDRYDRDFSGRGMSGDFDRDRPYGDRQFGNTNDYDDRPRNLGARDYETRHFGGGRGGFERGGMGQGGYGGSASYGAFQGSYGMGDYGGQRSYGAGSVGEGGMGGRERPIGRGGAMMGRGEGWGQAMGGSDLGFGYADREDIEDRGPHYGKGPKGYRRSDDRIKEEVCETIAQQGHIDASDVEVKVESGIVTLVGTVAQRHHKRSLEQLVEHLRGVEEVRNELRLKREEQGQTSARPQGNGGDQARPQQSHPNGKNVRA